MNEYLPRDGIVVVTGSRCPACVTAKRLLSEHHVPYFPVAVEEHPEIAQLGVRCLPTVFVLQDGHIKKQLSGLPRDLLTQLSM